jgi:hypothetical protein
MMVLNIDVLLHIDHIEVLSQVFSLGHGGIVLTTKKALENEFWALILPLY